MTLDASTRGNTTSRVAAGSRSPRSCSDWRERQHPRRHPQTIANSRVYTGHQTFVFSNLNTWGWIVTILGVSMVVAAFALFSGSELARWFGIFVAGHQRHRAALLRPAYPFWSLAMFAVDILIIYGLATYAGHKLRDA